ncbi:alpha-2,8-sialyltransferase 8E isoform X3 [Seriola lalandi dorsalis]|uniref:alpha-2,8-sialyltransferase 8E isoform X1 n=1 Tax=Seriola dumerili TaxID=41447 RepID=UPI000BBE9DDF|nr:alpha-2,8-sialyltransferase 8E isoform X1 [Seriola dumerili]XP_023264407.1 alpha-2,8-sialyltransferase 8E isoform X3 [Seriola lalandi dorsalis]XP_056259997.1 alpha-2,8-sialyltransferase 8E isoform X3 [Seriola aureovittata]
MLRRRMGYSDPSSGKDILGNRSLCFIFICAFGLVTLLQQILYGKNYIKSAQQFSRLKGDETGNWTGPVNFSDDGSLKPARNGRKRYLDNYDGSFDYNSTACRELRQEIMDIKVLTINMVNRKKHGHGYPSSFHKSLCLSARVKTSDLFERWRNLQVCRWEQNKEEASNFKMSLSRCCNAPSFLFTTKRNTPAGTKLRYEVDTSGILPITTEVFKMFPDDMPYSKSQYKKCAVIGNGGIIKNSKCGKEIDSADFVFRCNIPPINEKYSADVGTKTDLVTINPSIITERFQKLEKWRRPFYEVLQNYENSSVVLPAFYNTRNTDVSFRVKYMLDDFDSQRGVFFFHPQYLLNVQRFWAVQGVRAKRLSSGLMLVTAALEMCEEVHLYGFWAFPMNPSGIFITHHYYDNVKPRPGFHAMPHEIFNFIHMHTRGIINVHTGQCT